MFKVLAARVLIFAMSVIWVIGWLYAGILGLEVFTERLSSQPFLLYPWVISFLQVWYIITLVLIAIWVVVRGFRFVGKWERDED